MNINGKKLYRSVTDKVIGGVCGGLAQYTSTNSVWWRLGGLVLLLSTNVLVVGLYALALVVVPAEGEEAKDTESKTKKNQDK